MFFEISFIKFVKYKNSIDLMSATKLCKYTAVVTLSLTCINALAL